MASRTATGAAAPKTPASTDTIGNSLQLDDDKVLETFMRNFNKHGRTMDRRKLKDDERQYPSGFSSHFILRCIWLATMKEESQAALEKTEAHKLRLKGLEKALAKDNYNDIPLDRKIDNHTPALIDEQFAALMKKGSWTPVDGGKKWKTPGSDQHIELRHLATARMTFGNRRYKEDDISSGDESASGNRPLKTSEQKLAAAQAEINGAAILGFEGTNTADEVYRFVNPSTKQEPSKDDWKGLKHAGRRTVNQLGLGLTANNNDDDANNGQPKRKFETQDEAIKALAKKQAEENVKALAKRNGWRPLKERGYVTQEGRMLEKHERAELNETRRVCENDWLAWSQQGIDKGEVGYIAGWRPRKNDPRKRKHTTKVDAEPPSGRTSSVPGTKQDVEGVGGESTDRTKTGKGRKASRNLASPLPGAISGRAGRPPKARERPGSINTKSRASTPPDSDADSESSDANTGSSDGEEKALNRLAAMAKRRRGAGDRSTATGIADSTKAVRSYIPKPERRAGRRRPASPAAADSPHTRALVPEMNTKDWPELPRNKMPATPAAPRQSFKKAREKTPPQPTMPRSKSPLNQPAARHQADQGRLNPDDIPSTPPRGRSRSRRAQSLPPFGYPSAYIPPNNDSAPSSPPPGWSRTPSTGGSRASSTGGSRASSTGGSRAPSTGRAAPPKGGIKFGFDSTDDSDS